MLPSTIKRHRQLAVEHERRMFNLLKASGFNRDLVDETLKAVTAVQAASEEARRGGS